MLFTRCVSSFLIVCVSLAGVLSPATLQAADFSAPVIRLSLDRGAPKDGEPLAVAATVTDDQQVQQVLLRYRVSGSQSKFSSVAMKKRGSAQIYTATVPVESLKAPGIEYFVEARDEVGNVSQEPFPTHPRVVMIQGKESALASGNMKWLWVVAGALAVGALAGGGGGSSSGGDVGVTGEAGSATLTISAPTP